MKRPTAPNENRDALAERRMVHRVFIAMAIVIPICVVFFGLMVFIAARIGGVPAGAPVLMGVGIGVLAGIFFGMWAGVVASVHDIEALELAELPTTEVREVGDGGEAAVLGESRMPGMRCGHN